MDRKAKLMEQRAKLDAQLRMLEAREKDRSRKQDTRRKIIVGALALEHADANPDSEFAAVIRRLVNRYVTRPYDRKLMGVSGQDDEIAEPVAERDQAKA